MTTIIIPPEAGPNAHIPPHLYGGSWLYAVTDGSGAAMLSDSATELVAVDLPGYGKLPDDAALFARYDHLVDLDDRTQQWMLAAAVADHRLNLTEIDEDTLTTLFASRENPWEPPPGVAAEWKAVVPLVLLASDYEPYTERERPTRRIVWLDPTSEVAFLRSLAKLGLIHFRVLDPTAAA